MSYCWGYCWGKKKGVTKMRVANSNIQNKAVRKKFVPNKNPYFKQIISGLSLGYLVKEDNSRDWVAKLRDNSIGSKYRTITLGIPDDFAAPFFSINDLEKLLQVESIESVINTVRKYELGYPEATFLAVKWKDSLGKSNIRITVSECVKRYQRERGENLEGAKKVSDRTLSKDLSVFKKYVFSHEIAKKYVSDLNKDILERWMKSLGSSASTRNRVVTMLRAALNAHGGENITWKALKHVTLEVKEAAGRVLSIKEIQQLIDCADTQQLKDLLTVLALSGFRINEVRDLTPAHYNHKEKILRIPSGKTGARTVHVSTALDSVLVRLSNGKAQNDLLLTSVTGIKWPASAHINPIIRAGKNANLGHVKIYDLRHSFITHSLQAGMDLLTLTKSVGTSVKMIENNYFHLIGKSTVNVLDQFSPKLEIQ